MSSKQPAVEPSSKVRLQKALMRAIMNENPVEVRRCLDEGVNPNFISPEPDENHLTPLITACRHNSPEIVEILLRANADPNFANAHGYTPLLETVNREIEAEFAQAIGDQYLNIEACRKVFKTSVILRNDLRIVQVLLGAGADVNRADSQGRTPLFLAGESLRLDILLELFKSKADRRHLPESISLVDRLKFASGFKLMSVQLKKNPNATVDDMLDFVKKNKARIPEFLGGGVDIAEAIEKDDKALENYIRALQKVVDEYLSKKTTFVQGKAKLAGAEVFLERLKLLETMDEARVLAIPFSEVFKDKKLAKAAEEMLKNLPQFASQKNLQNVKITLDDLLSLNRSANKKEEPESLKKFRAAFKELEDEATAPKSAPKK